MTDTAAQAQFNETHTPRDARKAALSDEGKQSKSRSDVNDIATIVLLALLVVIMIFTFKDYAISNDEGVQHRYGELIIAYYESGFKDQSLFHFQNLYLYGGLFDIIAVALSQALPMDVYELRHLLCALIGIAGIAAAAGTARMVAGARAGLIAAVALSFSGAWYGTMFNHSKDIPFAAAMMGATLFLLRVARRLPSPRPGDVAAFGLLMGAALGIRVIGLLLLIYAGLVIVMYLPRRNRVHFAAQSLTRMVPALVIAYVVMILAWPWAALEPLNPFRGLLEFSEFHYSIRTLLNGKIHEMASVPPSYVPVYILIREPLMTLFGVALAVALMLLPSRATNDARPRRKEIAMVWLTAIIPLACQVAFRGPAFTGLRHFIFVLPSLAILAAIGIDSALTVLSSRSLAAARALLAVVTAGFLWDAVTLARLHPYEYLFYNPLVGGLQGASRRYDLDYWFGSMPESIAQLETYLQRTSTNDANWPNELYSVAVCGERLAFDKNVTLPQLRFDFKPRWDQSEFFIAPTHMNCDNDLDGNIIGAVTRLGIPIAYIKDRRALISAMATAK